MTYRIEECISGLWATAVALGDAQGWESAERAEEALDALSEHEDLSGQYRIVCEQTGEVACVIVYGSEAPSVPADAPTLRQRAHWDDLRTVKTDVPAWDFEGFWSVVIGRTPSLCVSEFKLTGDRTEVLAWVDEAAAQAWQAGGQGGRLPEEWAPYLDRAADLLAAEMEPADDDAEDGCAPRALVEAAS